MPEYWFSKAYADRVARMRVPCGFILVAAFAWFSDPDANVLSLTQFHLHDVPSPA